MTNTVEEHLSSEQEVVLRLNKKQVLKLRAALEDAIRDREEFVRCILEPFKYREPDADARQTVRETKASIAFCRRLERKLASLPRTNHEQR